MARKLRSDEFEARQRQIPADTRRNLGGANLQRSREDFDNTPLGSPPQCVDVRSVYDVRPINGFDFNIMAHADTSVEPPGTQAQLIATMTVPDGFVAVLRKMDIWLEPTPGSDDPLASNRSEYVWTLMLNGGDYHYNIDVAMGVAIDGETVFLLADEYNTIGLKCKPATGAFATPQSLYVRFYGNFLQKTERPAAFEIGNPVLGQNCAPPTQTVLRPPPKPAAPVARATPVPAPAPPSAPRMAIPPFTVLIFCEERNGKRTYIPGRPQGRGYLPLTAQQLTQFKDYIATLPKPTECKRVLSYDSSAR